MNILELDSFNLADTVKFHDRLNPRLWDSSEHLRPEVHVKLVEIARDFQEFLGVPDLDVKDITVSGSNAAYNYTPTSDIDLHLVVDLPQADNNEVYRELFDAKKFQYNNIHNIKIGGYDVELYVQNPNEEHHSQGIYSLLRNDWVSVPKRRKAEIDDISTKSKYEDLAARIDDTVNSGNHDSMAALMKKIKDMRQNGLDKYGELGADNLAFKLLRNNGYIKKLVDARNAARDRELSLDEAKKKKKKVKYGFGTYWYPGFAFGDSGEGGGDGGGGESRMMESPDGVNPSTKMFLEEPGSEDESTVRDFIDFVADRLGIAQMPEIVLHTDPAWSRDNKSFGRYTPETHTLEVNLANRHVMDILRTTAHELVHCRQNQERQLPGEAGKTGSRWENQAHAIAGVIMRDYADQNPAMFESSGYIPTDAEKNDPRFKMALTKDVRPGQTGKEANKMALKTDAQGRPGLLMKPANLRESHMPQPSQGQGKYRDLNKPLGPESPPTMPAGTVRVDVSDVYDWYKLGQHISNLKGLGKHDFGAGPPSTIISFGDEETEHKYIQDLEKTGLTTTDIDPKDPNQPAGMKRQKTDPTYDVNENELAESLLQELQVFEEQDLMEIKMTGKNLSKLAQAIPGVMVGLEFEMIVPNVDGPDNDDLEPDYDQDERVRDIDDAVRFFDDGDYNGRGDIRRLRESMEEDYQNWVMEQIDEAWFGGNGMEFFQEFLDREYPFDRDDAFEEARDEIMTANPDLPQDSEELQQLISARVDEMEANYYVNQWEEQGSYYDYAREEFEDEQRDSLSELDWLSSQGIRYASDVQNNYSDVSWPYWTSPGGDDTDAKQVALEFMNFMGYDTIAVGDYHGYGGGYELWNGSEWRNIGSNKPMDAFTVEPDGSLSGDDAGDTGLEFVSPPIPLAEIGDTMAKVQAWAAQNGVYTGKGNGTALHTNVSIPGYSIDKLDYLKAALLLGDEHVLRDFDRITNTYARPAIGKVKELVRNKPEKAQELLDKMKSQLDAEASKLIHSGSTDKYTSINTKDNRIEFRSPGGDYLSIIADNPQKMVDTINRMVVAMDAAMDPDKYKEEYQKKLYKLLTGQTFGRETQTGAKQEMKQDDKDLLNIFSRYAAGELPRAALKSFVRQAQLQRSVSKGETGGKMWWNVQWDNSRRIEVVATSKQEAKQVAAEEWRVPENQLAGAVITPLRPYKEETKAPTLNGRPSNPDGNYVIVDGDYEQTPVYRYMASDGNDAFLVLRQWISANPGRTQWNFKFDPTQLMGQPGEQQNTTPIPGSTLDLQRQRAAQQTGNWGIWINANDRFANQPGEYARGETPPLYRFPTQAAAEQWIEQQRAERPNMRADIEVREIEPSTVTTYEPGGNGRPAYTMTRPTEPIPEIPLDIEIAPPRTAAANPLMPTGPGPWEVASRSNNQVYYNPGHQTRMAAQAEAERWLLDNGHNPNDFEVRTRETAGNRDAAQGGIVDVAGDNWSAEFERRMQQQAPQTLTRPGQGQQVFTGEWKVVDSQGRELYQFGGVGNSQADANRVAAQWAQRNMVRDEVNVVPVMG
jgi:hypothetical protein